MSPLKMIILPLIILFSSPIWAQDSLFPVIDVEVSDDARVERHPTIREGMVEVVIRGCYQDLGSVLTGRTNPYVGGMDATYSGSGVWIVKAMMSRPDADLRVQIEDGRLVMDVVESVRDAEESEADLVSVRSLVEGTAPTAAATVVCRPAPAAAATTARLTRSI